MGHISKNHVIGAGKTQVLLRASITRILLYIHTYIYARTHTPFYLTVTESAYPPTAYSFPSSIAQPSERLASFRGGIFVHTAVVVSMHMSVCPYT